MKFKKIVELEEEVLDGVRKSKGMIEGAVYEVCKEFYLKSAECMEKIGESGRDDIEVEGFEQKCAALKRGGECGVSEKGEVRGGGNGVSGKLSESTIRVSMEKLDTLMNLIGELMIDKSRFEMVEKRMEKGEGAGEVSKDLRDATNSMGRITDELHRAIMDTRMVPIGTLFNRFPRVVRELSKKKGKEIGLAISGEETEIDKTIIEEINDPLLHIIRNAADHGIEAPDERGEKGFEGTIHLSARHESGSVVIEIEDDGKGIDVKVIGEKALRVGLVNEEQLSKMNDQEVMNMIFLPGFSTAEEVTEISGRGVGMDVVKTNIEKLRGKIHIETVVGQGTKFTLKLPLTMAIIETLMVRVGSEQFAIPLLAVNTIAQLPASELSSVAGDRTVTLHGKTLNAIRLGDVLSLEHDAGNSKVKIVVVETKRGTREEKIEVGFIVDAVHDKQKIVIKPLDSSYVGSSGYSGVTILGDGRVALVLDPVELIEMALTTRSQNTGI